MEKPFASEARIGAPDSTEQVPCSLDRAFNPGKELLVQPATTQEVGWVKTLQISYNASGAAMAAERGDVVVIVDVIDMSTTAEAVLEAGASAVFGAAPTGVKPPVAVNPEGLGYLAGRQALAQGTEVIAIAEPRHGTEAERKARIEAAHAGICRAGASLSQLLPNIGGEIAKLADFRGRVVLIVSDTGGVAFDAAWTHGAREVLTGTVARTNAKKGVMPLEVAARRAIKAADRHRAGITFVAASANSYEDIIAAEALAKKVIELGFLHS